jgi:hypothetical protein
VDLAPISGTTFAEFACGGVPVVIRGSVIGIMSPVSKMTKTFKVTFAESLGHQKYERFENEPPDTLEASVAGGAFGRIGLSSIDVVKNEELLEIREI